MQSLNKKIVLIINGKGGSGKDTVCGIVGERFKTRNISSVDPIKAMAKMAGWQGEKTDKARKFLSDLKGLTIGYNNYPTVWGKARFDEFMQSENEIMFFHIREAEEIRKFVEATGGVAKTLLIRGGSRMSKSHYGNVSDDEVENYSYDYYFVNDKSLEEAECSFCEFIQSIAG